MTNNHMRLNKISSLLLVLATSLMPFACTTNTQDKPDGQDDILDPWYSGEINVSFEEDDTIEGKKCHHVNKSGGIECSERKNGCDGFHGNLWNDTCWACQHIRDDHY